MRDARLTAAARLAPAAVLLGIWVAWIPLDGGYFPRQWYPAALFAAALVAVVALAGRRWLPESRVATVALALLAALTAWSFASMLWADSPAGAWDASNQLLLYLLVAWVVALAPWRRGSATLLFAVWSLAVAVTCGVVLVSALGAADLGTYILESRWQQPTGYANTAAALPSMAFWPALMLASRRGMPAALQVVFLCAAAFLLEFSLLPQSRAALVAMILAVPVAILLAPDRGRVLVRLAVVGVALAVSVDAVYDVYGASEAGRAVDPILHRAAERMLLGVAVAAVGAGALALIEGRVRAGPRVRGVARAGVLAALVTVLLGGAGAGLARAGHVADYVGDRWSEFKSTDSDERPPDHSASRIAQRTSDKRYDYWRVALNTFREAPAGGVGAGGYEREYTIHRRYPKPSRSAHSIWMRSLAETGVVGIALLAAFVVAVGVGLVRASRRLDAAGCGLVAACAATGTYFVAHASFDWLELLPALAAPAVALPFVVLALPAEGAGEAASEAGARGRRLPAWVAPTAAALLVAAAFVSLALPYLSLRWTDRALDRAGSDPAGTARDLDRAATLNPLSAGPRIAEGRIALREGHFAEARRAFEAALGTEDAWFPHFEIALIDARAGSFAGARREIVRAAALNPRDPLVSAAADLIAKRERRDPRSVDRRALGLPLYDHAGAPG